MNLIKQLLIIKKNKSLPFDKAVKLGINVSELRNKGLVLMKVAKTESLNIPTGVPKYAARFGFTRKKYGIDKVLTEKKSILLTEKGIKFLQKAAKKIEEDQPPNQTIDREIEESGEIQDQ